ncbi:hypothetical protein ACLOJK_018015 [Asimina triloba]
MASSSSCSRSRGFQNCNYFCGLPVIVLTSHTRKNPGRRFLRCSQYKDTTRRCGFFQWLDVGGQSKSSDEVRIHSEADNLTHKYHESESQSEVQTDKQDEIVGDMGELLQCVSMVNKEIRQLKKEVRSLKEVDRRHALDASVLRRNQVIIAFIMGIIVVWTQQDARLHDSLASECEDDEACPIARDDLQHLLMWPSLRQKLQCIEFLEIDALLYFASHLHSYASLTLESQAADPHIILKKTPLSVGIPTRSLSCSYAALTSKAPAAAPCLSSLPPATSTQSKPFNHCLGWFFQAKQTKNQQRAFYKRLGTFGYRSCPSHPITAANLKKL